MEKSNSDNLTDRFQDQTRIEPRRGRFVETKADKTSPFFGMVGTTVPLSRFRLLIRDGRVYSVPYALLPLVILEPERALLIRSSDLEITIQGRNLGKLEEALSTERVSWIKESPSGLDDGQHELFVSHIQIMGELTV